MEVKKVITVVQTKDQIDEVVDWALGCLDGTVVGTGEFVPGHSCYPNLKYEDGVYDAIAWLLEGVTRDKDGNVLFSGNAESDE